MKWSKVKYSIIYSVTNFLRRQMCFRSNSVKDVQEMKFILLLLTLNILWHLRQETPQLAQKTNLKCDAVCTEDNKTTKLMQHPAVWPLERGLDIKLCMVSARIWPVVALIFSKPSKLASSRQVIRLHKLSPSPLPAGALCSCWSLLRKRRIRSPPPLFCSCSFTSCTH